jgi:hypothetical protein
MPSYYLLSHYKPKITAAARANTDIPRSRDPASFLTAVALDFCAVLVLVGPAAFVFVDWPVPETVVVFATILVFSTVI